MGLNTRTRRYVSIYFCIYIYNIILYMGTIQMYVKIYFGKWLLPDAFRSDAYHLERERETEREPIIWKTRRKKKVLPSHVWRLTYAYTVTDAVVAAGFARWSSKSSRRRRRRRSSYSIIHPSILYYYGCIILLYYYVHFILVVVDISFVFYLI